MNGTQQTVVWLALIAAVLTLILTGHGVWVAAPAVLIFIWYLLQ